MNPYERLAQELYKAFCKSVGDVNLSGNPTLSWEANLDSVQQHWYFVAALDSQFNLSLKDRIGSMNHCERPARECYERYSQHCGGMNHQGLPMPPWQDLTEDTRQHWMYAIAPLVKLKKT